MAVITATSDYGIVDPALPAFKGRLFSAHPEAVVVDITHSIDVGNTGQAVHVLRTAFPSFPKGTVHIMLVGAHAWNTEKYIAMKANGQYFVGINNGVILAALSNAKIQTAHEIDLRGKAHTDVHGILCETAVYLSKGGKIDMLGPQITTLNRIVEPAPIVGEFSVGGVVSYVDRYGTCVTNIKKSHVPEEAHKHNLSVALPKNRHTQEVLENPALARGGDLAAWWNSEGLLCVGIGGAGTKSSGKSNKLLGMEVNDWVRIDFTI